MKITITESQLKLIIEQRGGARTTLSPEELEKRVALAKELAPQYKNPYQFKKDHQLLYGTLVNYGLIDQVFPKRKKNNPEGYWTKETVADEARKYDSRVEFYRNNQVAYAMANKLGIIDVLFPEERKRGAKLKYDLDGAIELAKKFDGSRTEFFRQHTSAFKQLKDNDLLHVYLPEKRGRKSYEDDELLDKAKQYTSIVDLKKNDPRLYLNLKNNALIDKVFPHDLRIQKLLDVAKLYKNKYELKANNIYFYKKLEELGLLDIAYPKLSLSDLSNDNEDKSKED